MNRFEQHSLEDVCLSLLLVRKHVYDSHRLFEVADHIRHIWVWERVHCAVYTGESGYSMERSGRVLLDEECRHCCCLYRAPPDLKAGGLRFSRISWWWCWGVLRGCWIYTGESTRWVGAEEVYPTRWKMSSFLLPLQQGIYKYMRWHSVCFQIISNKNAESTGTAHGPNWLSDAKPSSPAGLPARGLDTPQGWELSVV
jgi:hypothetical protein